MGQTVYILKCDNPSCRTHDDDYPVRVIYGSHVGTCKVCGGFMKKVEAVEPQPVNFKKPPVYL